MVEGEAQRQQHAALEHAARHARVADGAEQDRVVAPQLLEHRVGQGLAGRVPAAGAEVVLGGRDLEPARRRDRVEDLQALGDDLRADAVAADDGEVEGVVLAEWRSLGQPWLQPTECRALGPMPRTAAPARGGGRSWRRPGTSWVAQSSVWPWSRRSIDSCRA